MIAKGNKRLEITLKKESLEMISLFAKELALSKSEFIECVCLSFINDVVAKTKALDKNLKKNIKKGKA